jgi:lipopolysaccharide transport system permease protein
MLRNINAQYRQTLFGYLWAFIGPIATAATFILLNRARVFSTGELSVPYPLYVVTGVLFWQSFVDALTGPLRLVESSKAMLAKINFPREALLIAAAGEAAFNLLVRLVLVAAVMAAYRQVPTHSIVFFPVAMASLLLLGLVVGVCLTPLGVLFQDVGRGITMITTFWMLLTPIAYSAEPGDTMAEFNRYNPVAPLLVTARDCVLGLQIQPLGEFWLVTGIVVLLAFVGWAIFRVSLPHVIARIEA